MAEQNKTQMGDGADNYGQAAGQMAKAAKQLGQEAAKQAAAKGVEATANAATAAVQASVEGGKAAAEIAAGTAAGGPWGAILSAAWAMRHTLFKIRIYGIISMRLIYDNTSLLFCSFRHRRMTQSLLLMSYPPPFYLNLIHAVTLSQE